MTRPRFSVKSVKAEVMRGLGYDVRRSNLSFLEAPDKPMPNNQLPKASASNPSAVTIFNTAGTSKRLSPVAEYVPNTPR